MPLNYFHGRWHFHQRMNKKVSHNLDRLNALIAKNPSKAEILDTLHPWRTSILLKYNNTFAVLQFVIGFLLFFMGVFWMFSLGGWAILLWLIGLGLCTYAYFSFEQQSEIDSIIGELSGQVFQDQYQVKFNQFPTIDKSFNNPTRLLTLVKNGFDCLNEGNFSNSIETIAATQWDVNGHLYPVLLFHYKFIDESIVRDPKNQTQRKQTTSHRWGACVFDMPALAFVVSGTETNYPRYPRRWTPSDIQFNQKYKIKGQQELELARNLTPPRILALATNLDALRGSIMFHDQMNAFCYLSQQNIFSTQAPAKKITDISMLRGYLRTLKAPHYEKVKTHLSDIITHFSDDKFFKT